MKLLRRRPQMATPLSDWRIDAGIYLALAEHLRRPVAIDACVQAAMAGPEAGSDTRSDGRSTATLAASS